MTEGLLKVGELARQSETSLSTVKFYVKEGLIRPACKTGRNMAYYDPSCVETIRRIRALQRERYYPLSVIKHLLESGQVEQPELELLDAIHKVDRDTPSTRYTTTEAARVSGLDMEQIAALHSAGLITPAGEGRRQTYGQEDLSVMELVRRRMDAGIPFAQSVRAFTIYDQALREAARADVDAFTMGAMMAKGFDAETGARMIRVSDDTLDAFVGLKRRAFNRRYGSSRLEDLDRFDRSLRTALEKVTRMLEQTGRIDDAAMCMAALQGAATGLGCLDEAARAYTSIGSAGGDVAGSVAACVASRTYFAQMQPEQIAGGEIPAWCMKLAWLTLAPEILDCRMRAEEGWMALQRTDSLFAKQLAAVLKPEEEIV